MRIFLVFVKGFIIGMGVAVTIAAYANLMERIDKLEDNIVLNCAINHGQN